MKNSPIVEREWDLSESTLTGPGDVVQISQLDGSLCSRALLNENGDCSPDGSHLQSKLQFLGLYYRNSYLYCF